MLFQVRPGNLAGHRGVSLPRASKPEEDGVCWHGGWGRLNVETTSSRDSGQEHRPAEGPSRDDSALDSYLPRDLG